MRTLFAGRRICMYLFLQVANSGGDFVYRSRTRLVRVDGVAILYDVAGNKIYLIAYMESCMVLNRMIEFCSRVHNPVKDLVHNARLHKIRRHRLLP